MSDLTPEVAFKKCQKFCNVIARAVDLLALDDGMLKEEWEDEITRLKAIRMPSVPIAICGTTGSGKSSLFNALFDRDILCTSGAGAGTNVAIEIGWHSTDNMQATINFLSEDEWRAELDVLLEYVQAFNGSANGTEDASVAWAKIQAVYPTLALQDFTHLTVDQIINHDHQIVSLLRGQTLVIVEQDSASFDQKIQRYIGASERHSNANEPNKVGYWPLVKLVSILCNADILSTGAILVDLPGVADVNPARNRIAQDYFQHCDRIWIASHVARVADDKVAQDLLGSAFKMQLKMDSKYGTDVLTCIATKTDDVRSPELVRNLRLENEAEVVDNLGRIRSCEAAVEVQKARIAEMSKEKKQLKREREQLVKLVNMFDEPNAPNTGTGAKRRIDETDLNSGQTSKRTKFSLLGNVIENRIEHTDDTVARNASVQIRTLTMNSDAIGDHLEEARELIASLERDKNRAQQALDTFCSTRRSELSKIIVKEHFRIGLKQLDDIIEEQLHRETFDPTMDIRDYASIDLPVFTVSARDYIKLTRPATGDGKPTCFSCVKDTEIPALKDWCHAQTFPFRKAAVIAFLNDIQTLLVSISSYFSDVDQAAVEDQQALRRQWESLPSECRRGRAQGTGRRTGGVSGHLDQKLSDLVKTTVLQLQRRFRDALEDDCTKGAALAAEKALPTLQKMISVVETRMPWQTFRATLRRDGSWKSNINLELVNPLTIAIMRSWCSIFEADMFADFQKAAKDIVENLLREVVDSVSRGAEDRVKSQTEVCSKEAKLAFEATMNIVRKTMSSEQKSASRCYEPYIQEQLRDKGYRPALIERGKGSVERQRRVVEDAVDDNKDSLFADAADVLLQTLEGAVNRIGDDLKNEMGRIGRKVESTLSIIWSRQHTTEEYKKTLKTVQNILNVLEQDLQLASMW